MFLTRCEDESKNKIVYFTTENAREVMENKDDCVKKIKTGVKTFARCENKGAGCDYRIVQEESLSSSDQGKNDLTWHFYQLYLSF